MLSIRPKRILYRIVVPFSVLFGLTTLSTWFFSAYFITRYLDQSLRRQMERVIGVISQAQYLVNPVVLRQLKDVINAEIVLIDGNGRITSSTLSDPTLLDPVPIPPGDLQRHASQGKDVQIKGMKYRILIHPLNLGGQEASFLSLWMPTGEMDSLRQRMVLSIGGIALLGIIAMAWIGYHIARSITSPLEELARMTARISDGHLSEHASHQSTDEIGRFADSFNHMVDRLKDSEARLVRSEKMATAGRMAAGLAHEVRNPLTSIKMLGQVLQGRMKDQPENQEMIVSLVQEIDRLDRIIQEMIDRTRPGKLKKQWADVNRQIREVVRVAEEGIHAENISIQANLSDRLPDVLMDPEKIKQVLWNLILNAKEAMPGGGQLILSTGRTNHGMVEIAVEDNGRGIPAGEAEILFQPFFTTKPEGLGLGLSMSRKIVEQHGGSLTLESRPEGGVKARITLPLSMDHPDALTSEAEKRI